MRPYDEDEWLTRYIWNHYTHLMNRAELRAHHVLALRAKAESCEEDSPIRRSFERKISEVEEDPRVRRLLSNGIAIFRRAVRDRLLSTHPWRIKLNRCPHCNRIPRTPRAKQCPWCFKRWR